MDIDHLRYMLREGLYRSTQEFDRRLDEREFTLKQAMEAVFCGRIVRETPGGRGLPKCTVEGFVPRKVAGLEVPELGALQVACAVGDEVIFITGYWRTK